MASAASTILAALANAVFLLVATGAIGWEAILRLREPEPVAGVTVMVVAGIGILINGFTAMLFASGRKDDINIEGAYPAHGGRRRGLARRRDLGGADHLDRLALARSRHQPRHLRQPSCGARPACCAAPSTCRWRQRPRAPTSPRSRRSCWRGPGVSAIHDLHVWPISTTETALTCHLVMPAGTADAFLMETAQQLKASYRIGHTTLQVETHPDNGCALAPDDVV